ncbi:MAG: TetR/AcrR family transcriptional regulator [Solirubrobacterales bacterium]|nr:TetR/AcrR family transcriptional regulator [Solirubrobacterales bacterium]MBV9363660.1 TetR/AcrR family transcriptional regulator [Solirubrobacterales bacterium]MBV9809804.1 TetR/AcrR family transcriptional regulator [Solirubrobacterales bacterium]
MSPRDYQLGKRAAGVAETRTRIVEAARAVFAQDGFHRAPVEAVARRADVARATVYYQFDSRLGLIEAVLDDVERRGGQQRVLTAVALADAIEATRRAFEEGSRFWAAEHILVRKLIGLAAADPEIRRLVVQRDRNRLALVTRLAERLRAQRRLRPGCSIQTAIQTLWLLSSFEAFDQLFTGQGLAADDIAAFLFELAVRALLRSP